MHELAICDAILKRVDRIVKEERLEGVNSVTLEIGTLSGVVPAFMTDCWQAVIDGTPYAETALLITTDPGVAECLDCGAQFTADPEKLVCPKCGGGTLNPLTGTDLTIAEINAY